MSERTGHCLCGATTYAFDPDGIRFQAICHCADCRRASGAPMVGWIGVTDGVWRWTGRQPATHASSPGVTRAYCSTCGSPLAYSSTRWPGETHFTAATLSEPADFHPAVHVCHAEALAWAAGDDTLPRLSAFGSD